MVMPANNTGARVGYLAALYPGRIGNLYSPGGQRGPFDFLPYALDNGAFGAYKTRTTWSEASWLSLLDWAKMSGQRPLWVIVPDVVADREATLQSWQRYSPVAARYGWPLAFSVQDGMTPDDVPAGADVVFVGGTSQWKWQTTQMWCDSFPRVHVGRVNSYRHLVECDRAGAESVDGTGWFRGRQAQYRGLLAYLHHASSGSFPNQQSLLFGEVSV